MPDPDFTIDLAASSMRHNAADNRSLIEALANQLESALPLQTDVRRKPVRRFSGQKSVRHIRVTLDDESYELSVDRGQIHPTRHKNVGGVTIKREALELDDWLDALSKALTAAARRSEAIRRSLAQLI